MFVCALLSRFSHKINHSVPVSFFSPVLVNLVLALFSNSRRGRDDHLCRDDPLDPANISVQHKIQITFIQHISEAMGYSLIPTHNYFNKSCKIFGTFSAPPQQKQRGSRKIVSFYLIAYT